MQNMKFEWGIWPACLLFYAILLVSTKIIFFVIDVKTKVNFIFSTLIQICYLALNFVAK